MTDPAKALSAQRLTNRKSLVTHAEASLASLHDTREDITSEAYQLLVGAAPELLALAAADPHVRAKAMAQLKARALRYRAHVLAELKR